MNSNSTRKKIPLSTKDTVYVTDYVVYTRIYYTHVCNNGTPTDKHTRAKVYVKCLISNYSVLACNLKGSNEQLIIHSEPFELNTEQNLKRINHI